jgi:hypothetical protein
MKQLIIISQALLTLSFLTGCTSTPTSTPSQNSALNSISKSNAAKEKKGIMQESLDGWLQNDWTPTVEKNEKIQKKYMTEKEEVNSKTIKTSQKEQKTRYTEKEDKPFTLQEYVDKAEAYMEEKPNNYNESNVKKLDSLPVIGK